MPARTARNSGTYHMLINSPVLVVCEDFDELLALSVRLLVMAGARLVSKAPVEQADISASKWKVPCLPCRGN